MSILYQDEPGFNANKEVNKKQNNLKYKRLSPKTAARVYQDIDNVQSRQNQSD